MPNIMVVKQASEVMKTLITQLLLSGILAAARETFKCTAGTFLAGETASITCDFFKDVSELQHYNYHVEWYPYDSADNINGNEAMSCFRIQSGKLKCNPAKGFRFNDTINERLVLEIPYVTEHFAGRYSCQYVPPDGKKIEACSLNVTVVAKTRIPRIPSDTLATQTPSNTEPNPHPSKEPVWTVTIAATFTAATVVTVSLILVMYVVYRTRRLLRKHKCERRRISVESLRMQRQREISTEEGFEEWLKKIPTPAREALANEGFEQMIALKSATDDDINSLQLKTGHRYLVEDAKRRLQDSSERSCEPILPCTDSRKAAFNNNNTQTKTTEKTGRSSFPECRDDCGSASSNSPTPASDENV
eukprot:GHVL01007148.1.p1 GENE.GHVL01007148.1~~GHVL01007148.1.p1  ORF type:complete len:361 (+),score=33.23 GHVL01007148.1:399-1481(+)